MPATITESSLSRHLQTLESVPARRPITKASLHSVEKTWTRTGDAMAHAIHLARLSRKEAAARIGMDRSQLTKECEGHERPQIERFLNDDVLRGPMLIALAEQDPERFDVRTVITVRRTA